MAETPSKSIFVSKTFWLNIIGIAITVAGFLPAEYGAAALGILNILNRFFTSQPVTVLPQ